MLNLNNIETSLKTELVSHIMQTVSDSFNADDHNFEELHYHAFNEDFYIIGYYEASQWLSNHNIDSFEAINFINDYSLNNFGDAYFGANKEINSENVVNMVTYILGDELINELDIDLTNTNQDELTQYISDYFDI